VCFRKKQKILRKHFQGNDHFSGIVYIYLYCFNAGSYRNGRLQKFDGVGDPLSFIFEKGNANVAWMELVVSFVAIVAITLFFWYSRWDSQESGMP
jgi:hypothetical protein